AAIVVAADSPEAWRKALEEVSGDANMAADLRRRGILRAAEFSWTRSAELTWRVLDRVLTGAAALTAEARPCARRRRQHRRRSEIGRPCRWRLECRAGPEA